VSVALYTPAYPTDEQLAWWSAELAERVRLGCPTPETASQQRGPGAATLAVVTDLLERTVAAGDHTSATTIAWACHGPTTPNREEQRNARWTRSSAR